jgi:hypothetical protein
MSLAGTKPLFAIMLICAMAGTITAIAISDLTKAVGFGIFVPIGVYGILVGGRE